MTDRSPLHMPPGGWLPSDVDTLEHMLGALQRIDDRLMRMEHLLALGTVLRYGSDAQQAQALEHLTGELDRQEREVNGHESG